MKWKNRKERPQHHGIYHIKDEKTGKGIYYFGTKYNKWFWSLPEDGLINVSKEVGKGYDFVWLDESEQDEGWVPVEKNLPQDSVRVLCFCEGGHQEIGYVDEEDWWSGSRLEPFFKIGYNITHWRPLPVPPATKD